MANYKNINTLVKNLENTTEEMLAGIIDNEMVDVSTLTDREKLAVLVFAELAKALKTKEHQLVLDCNYAASKFHGHEDEAKDIWAVDYFRLVPTANVNSTLIQFYVRPSVKQGACNFTLCTSCAKANREQFEALEEDLHFIVKRDKNTGRAKTSQRNNVTYEEVVDVVKSVCAILANTQLQAEAVKKAKAEAKAKAQKEQSEKKAQKVTKSKKAKEVNKSDETENADAE